jgi:alpha-tubulin suppressor-like RCC1 family protein
LSRDVLDAAASGSHVCALLGYPLRVVCWGDDAAGQLGRGDDGDPAVPGVVPGLSGVEAVAALPQESWALTHAGSFSWGNVRQPAGNRVATPAPQQMRSAPPNAVRFATGLSAHGWGYLTADGEIFAFGSGGSFANGSERAEMITVPTRVAGISAAVDYSVSNMTSCAVLASGTVYCWGARGYFLPPTPDRPFDAWPPERVAGIDDAVRVYLGSDFACALTRTHQVRCWGRVNRDPENNHGTAVIAAAGPAMSLPPVRELMVSYSHACALTLDGDVYCWGDNDLSQLGVRGLPRNSSAPVFVFHPR